MNAHYLNGKTSLRWYLRRLPLVFILSLLSLIVAQASPPMTAPDFSAADNGQFVWARALGGTEEDLGGSIFVDTVGNVYTTGWFLGTADFDPGSSTFNLTSAGFFDTFVSKLDSTGNFVWSRAWGGPGFDEGKSIFVDEGGDVYTTGWFDGKVDFDPGPGTYYLTSSGDFDIFVSKLDSAGDLIWAKALKGPDRAEAFSIYVDGSGGVYTTGWFYDTVDFDPGPGVFNLTSTGLGSIFVSKLDEAGNFVWAKAMGGGEQWGNSIFVDKFGDVYITGGFEGTTDFDPGAGVFKLTSIRNADIFICKLDDAGNFIWAKAMGGTDWEEAESIFVDGAGDVYTTGAFWGTVDFDPGDGTFNLTSTGADWTDVFVSKLDNAGNFVWARAFGGLDADGGSAVSVDAEGYVYTTGMFYDTVDFDPGVDTFNLISAGKSDIFVSKLDNAGDFVWAKTFGSVLYDLGKSIFVDIVGNVHTTGWFESTADFDPGSETFNLTSAGESDIFVSKLGVAARIAVTNHAVRSAGKVTITLTIENRGTADGSGTQLSIPAPANASGFSWTCSAANGATCPAPGGSGDILHTLDAFPAGGEITYHATGKIINPSEPVASRGVLTPPPGVSFTDSPRFHFGEYWNTILPWIFMKAFP